jgi:hypothetical protein
LHSTSQYPESGAGLPDGDFFPWIIAANNASKRPFGKKGLASGQSTETELAVRHALMPTNYTLCCKSVIRVYSPVSSSVNKARPGSVLTWTIFVMGSLIATHGNLMRI